MNTDIYEMINWHMVLQQAQVNTIVTGWKIEMMAEREAMFL